MFFKERLQVCLSTTGPIAVRDQVSTKQKTRFESYKSSNRWLGPGGRYFISACGQQGLPDA